MEFGITRCRQLLALGRAAAARFWLRLDDDGHAPPLLAEQRTTLAMCSQDVISITDQIVRSWPRAIDSPLGRVFGWLAGDPEQLALLALAAAPLLDGALARSYESLAPRGVTTLGFLLDLAAPHEPERLALAARIGEEPSLVSSGLLEIDAQLGLAVTAPVRVPPAVLAALRGIPIPVPAAVKEIAPPGEAPAIDLGAIGLPADAALPLLLVGPSPWALHTIGRILAGQARCSLWTAQPPPELRSDAQSDAGWTRLLRDAALAGALVACDLAPEREIDPLVVGHRAAAAVRAAQRFGAPLVAFAPDEDAAPALFSRGVRVVSLLGLPASAGTALAEGRLRQDGVADAAAIARRSIAPLAPGVGQVEALVDAHRRGVLEDTGPAAQAELAEVLRPRLGNLVERVARRVSWDALVLPADVKTRLREMVLYRRHAERVYRELGLGEHVTGEGVAALFSGPPGTGKTLAASVIATELGIALYRVDLSRIVSKWVGETEKNLARLFAEARHGHAVLLFDEADSLFGKRTEVKSSVDRYANLEVNFLLQKLDHFDGIAILTTNAASAIDDAFLRRLQFRVTFEPADHESRVLLWQRHLPAAEHLASDVSLDEIADRYEFSGGNIRNAAIRAAFLAAGAGEPIAQSHLLRASVTESEELGRVVKR